MRVQLGKGLVIDLTIINTSTFHNDLGHIGKHLPHILVLPQGHPVRHV